MSHQHTDFAEASTGGLKIAFFLNLGFALLELLGGFWINSLAILSDSLHDLGDSVSLGLSWYLGRYAEREEDLRYSYGYRRYSILGALINALILVGGGVLMLFEAFPRLLDPESPNAPGMAAFAVVGIVINGVAALRLRRDASLNAKMVAWHLLEDVLGWAGVLLVGIVLLFWELPILDPLLSIAITLYVLYNVAGNLKKTSAIFLQAVPEPLNIEAIEADLLEIPHVCDVHHTHIWSLDGEHHVLTTHLVLASDATKDVAVDVKCAAKATLGELDLTHVTIEIEYGGDSCSMRL
jgi:cobalt-zinc-cadmium efflux system protein